MTQPIIKDALSFIDSEGRVYVGNDAQGTPRFATLADMRAENLSAVTVPYGSELKSNFTGAALAAATSAPIGRIHVLIEEGKAAGVYELDNYTLAAGPVLSNPEDLTRQIDLMKEFQKQYGKSNSPGGITAWEAYCRNHTPGYEKFMAQRAPARPSWAD